MKSALHALPLAAILLVAATGVEGYQFRTHEKITRLAFEKSEGLWAYLQAVGIHSADRFVPFVRTAPSLLAEFFNDGTARDWMIEGVIREDDFSFHEESVLLGCPLPENPHSPIDRVFNHFYDVQRGGRGLTIALKTMGLPAPEWALGKQGVRPLENDYSLPGARDYQFRSLTANSRSERELNTALFFRTLGHVIHLLQDTAQPQHTRNDPHSGCVPPIGGHTSWYEEYIETRALERKFRTRGEESRALNLGGYAPPKLASYEAYWKDPKGLAAVSSRNFFSAGTNLRTLAGFACGGLPDPTCSEFAYKRKIEEMPVYPITGGTRKGWVQVLEHTMVDPVTGEIEPPVKITSRSFWDQHLEVRGFLPVFTLNTVNYDSAAALLIPRAVGYSAGLLNRFFRASVSLAMDEDQRFFFQNGSPDEALNGTFFFLREDPQGVRVPLASFALVIPPSGESTRVNIPKLPANPPPGTRCWVVFRGTLGEEPNVVAGGLTDCPVEPPPPIQGTEWASYTCLFIPHIPGRPASPDEYIYYVYATQAWIVDQDGNPARSMSPNWRTQCWLNGLGFVPDGQIPPDVRLEFIPADFVPAG